MRELIESFVARQVDFTIVGGFAVAYHGYPRYTGDIDLLVRQQPDNLARVLDALTSFGMPLATTAAALLEPKVMLMLGKAPNRIDILVSIDGVTADAVWAGRVSATLDGIPVAFIGRAELLTNKASTTREKDKADLVALLARPPRRGRMTKKPRG